MHARAGLLIVALATPACAGSATRESSAVRDPPAAEQPAAADAGAKAWEPPENQAPRRWLVLGPFRQEPGAREAALDHDYLAPIGGEAAPRIDASTAFEAGGKRLRVQQVEPDPERGIDLKALYVADTDFSVAYAYGEIARKDAEEVHAIFGSDDGAAVWLNGARIHRVAASRGLDPDSDHFAVPLRPGVNRLLVKVENGDGGWGFALRLLDQAGQERVRAIAQRRHLEELELGPESRDFSLGEEFPALVWGRELQARAIFGAEPPRVRWFGPELEPVERPERPGRYIAVVEARMRDGFTHRAMLSFDRSPSALLPHLPRPPLAEPPLIRTELPPGLTDAQRAELSRHFWRALAEYLREGENAAIARNALAELAERPPSRGEPAWLQSGFIVNSERQLALRMKLEGRAARPLAPPAAQSPPAPVLRVGSELRAGMKPGTVARLRRVSREWAKHDPDGFVVLVARRGVIFMHEGFGGVRKDRPFWPASIGKLIAGLTFARAVDQGLVAFDDTLGSVLPEWKHERTARVTFRHCFDHVVGLPGHVSHDGLFNAYLDNALLVQDAAFVEPLRSHRYNGDSYNLAGKALELITGQSMWRLLYENLQRPFEEPATQFDLGFGDQSTARYLAKVGQMLLQDGAYGAHRFFRPGFVATLRPRRIADHTPGFADKNLEWGIGQVWMPDPSSAPRENGVLGPNVFGHGAASGSVFRIAPDHELVVVIGRDAPRDWRKNEEFTAAFMKTLAEGLRDSGQK
jgi:CubicO group peptidase (beta-lactamase class C family)